MVSDCQGFRWGLYERHMSREVRSTEGNSHGSVDLKRTSLSQSQRCEFTVGAILNGGSV